MDMALLIILNINGLLKSGAVSSIFSLHAGPIYSTGNLTKPPLMPIFNEFKYILCRMDMALLIIQNLNDLLNFGAVFGIFLLHARPIYSSENQVKLLFLHIFNVFKYILCRMDMALIIFWMPDSWLDSGAISGIFSFHAGPMYSTGNLRKLPFLPIFNVFKYISCRLDMALIVFRMPDD